MPLNVRAAVVHGPNQPFVVEEVQLEGPRGEVLVQVKTTGCATPICTPTKAKCRGNFRRFSDTKPLA